MLEGPNFPTNARLNLKYTSWTLRLIASIILFQTLYYKFGGHPDSVLLFTQLGAEPYGRYVLGVLELIAGVLILLPLTTVLGAIIALGLMVGAIFTHLFLIGIVFNNDGGKLFMLAVGCFLACLSLCIIFKNQIISYVRKRYVI